MTDEERELHEKLQPVYEKAMGPYWYGSDKAFFYKINRVDTIQYPEPESSCFVRIPAAIDSDGPGGMPSERCLWGMLIAKYDDTSFILKTEGKISSITSFNGWNQCRWSISANTPTLALLKALCRQHGIEVTE